MSNIYQNVKSEEKKANNKSSIVEKINGHIIEYLNRGIHECKAYVNEQISEVYARHDIQQNFDIRLFDCIHKFEVKELFRPAKSFFKSTP